MSKIEEFIRINQPRVERAQQQLALVRKSAASMRIDPDTRDQLLGQFANRPATVWAPMAEETERPVDPALRFKLQKTVDGGTKLVKATPPVANEASRYADLPTTQLMDKMIAIGAILAERRK